MADSNTTTYSFTLPEVGASADSWGTKLNANWDKVDDLLDGSIAVNGITVTGGSIDGTPVGATTPSTGAFTTVTTTGNVDVTGTVTADGLTVDKNYAFQGANYHFKLGENSGDSYLGSFGNGHFSATGYYYGSNQYQLTGGSTNLTGYAATSDFTIFAEDGLTANSLATSKARLRIDGATGDVSFYEDTGTTAKMVWDASAESLNLGGIATANTAGFSQNLAIKSQYPSISLEDTSAGTAKFTIGATNGNLGFWDSTASAYRMTIDSSGNVGIGVTPSSAWHPTWMDVVQIGNVGASIYGSTTSYSANNYLFIANNSVYDGTNEKYVRSAPALQATLGSNEFRWNQAPSGTAGSNIAWNRSMTLDASGNLLVGKTSPNITTSGIELHSNDYIASTAVSQAAAYFTRQTTDGDIALFRKDGTTVGSIGAEGGDLVIGTGSTAGLQFNDATPTIRPWNMSANTRTDGVCDLGYSNSRFKDLYLSGGVYLGGTGSANKLDDYEEGTWTPAIGRTSSSPTVTYGYQDGKYTKIGETVYVTARVSWSSVSGGSGAFTINSLPFPFLNSAGSFSSPLITDYGGVNFVTNGTSLGGYGVLGNNHILLLNGKDDGGNSAVIAGLASSGFIYFTMAYRT